MPREFLGPKRRTYGCDTQHDFPFETTFARSFEGSSNNVSMGDEGTSEFCCDSLLMATDLGGCSSDEQQAIRNEVKVSLSQNPVGGAKLLELRVVEKIFFCKLW